MYIPLCVQEESYFVCTSETIQTSFEFPSFKQQSSTMYQSIQTFEVSFKRLIAFRDNVIGMKLKSSHTVTFLFTMVKILKIKTKEGFNIKILSEILQNYITNSCFEFTASGISLRQENTDSSVFVDLFLEKDKFLHYESLRDNIQLGINLMHLHKMLAHVKKKDEIKMIVDEKDPSKFNITVKHFEKNRKTRSFLNITRMQPVKISMEDERYEQPFIISSSEFQKTLKDLNSLGKVIEIETSKNWIKFSSNGEEIYSREVIFGKKRDGDIILKQTFDTSLLTQLVKISNLSVNVQIYTCDKLPLKIKFQVGTLGTMAVYIESKERMNLE